MNKFSNRLKELRLDKGLTQTTLSKETGLSQAAIAKWENESRSPSIDCLITLAKYFNCTIDYLVGLSNDY